METIKLKVSFSFVDPMCESPLAFLEYFSNRSSKAVRRTVQDKGLSYGRCLSLQPVFWLLHHWSKDWWKKTIYIKINFMSFKCKSKKDLLITKTASFKTCYKISIVCWIPKRQKIFFKLLWNEIEEIDR